MEQRQTPELHASLPAPEAAAIHEAEYEKRPAAWYAAEVPETPEHILPISVVRASVS